MPNSTNAPAWIQNHFAECLYAYEYVNINRAVPAASNFLD